MKHENELDALLEYFATGGEKPDYDEKLIYMLERFVENSGRTLPNGDDDISDQDQPIRATCAILRTSLNRMVQMAEEVYWNPNQVHINVCTLMDAHSMAICALHEVVRAMLEQRRRLEILRRANRDAAM